MASRCLLVATIVASFVPVVSGCSSSSASPVDSGSKDVAQPIHDGGHADAREGGRDAKEDDVRDAGLERSDGADGGGPAGLTCAGLLGCDQACTSSACTNGCFAMSTVTAQHLFSAFDDCLNVACPGADASACDTTAATGACVSQLLACESDKAAGPPNPDGGIVAVDAGAHDAGTELNCGQLAQCESACGDAGASCEPACVDESTAEAQALLNTLDGCLATQCPAGDGGVCSSAGSACTGCRTQAEFDTTTCGSAFSTCQSDTSNAPDASTGPVALLGGTITTLASGLDQPQIVLVQAGRVFYSQVSQAGDVSSVSLADAGAPSNIGQPQPFPMGLAVDPTNIYVWNSGTFSGSSTLNNDDGTVVQLPLAGGTPVTLTTKMEVAYAAPYLNAVIVSGSTVYWVAGASGHDGTIMSVPVGGGSAASAVFSNQPFPEALASDGTDLYWTVWGTFDAQGNYNNDGAVLKGPIGGGTITTLASSQSAPAALALDASNVYWSNAGKLGGDNLPAPNTGSVMQVSKAGGTVIPIATAEAVPLGIAVSGGDVYWAEYTLSGPGQIVRAPIGGGTLVPLVGGLSDPFGIAITGTTIVWSDSPPTQAGSGKILALEMP